MKKAISLFSGAGGFDVGFIKTGFSVIWANDFNAGACKTYKTNIGDHIQCGDIGMLKNDLFEQTKDQTIDVIFGGPPCQGFSAAGKMNPDDKRSQLVWEYVDIIKTIQPKAFVMENVAALGEAKKWSAVRSRLLREFKDAGYIASFIILKASDFDVPQRRSRVFFIGFKSEAVGMLNLSAMLTPYKKTAGTVREALALLGKQSVEDMASAKVIFAKKPVATSTPYTSFLVNGGTVGGFINIDGYSPTLTASMGGNLTPIIDEEALYNGKPEWVFDYYYHLKRGGEPKAICPPDYIRRISTQEAAAIQTFPLDYVWTGSNSATYKQIGNAVPCNMALALAEMINNSLTTQTVIDVSMSDIKLEEV